MLKTLLVIIRTPESNECLDAAIKVLRDGGCGVEVGKEEEIENDAGADSADQEKDGSKKG